MKSIEMIKTLAEDIALPTEMQSAVIPLCQRIVEAYTEEYCTIAEDIENEGLIFALADKMEAEHDPVMLAVSLMLGADAHDLYKSRGISDEIYIDSMRDITIWAKTCQKMRGHIGLYEYGWIKNFLNASIVRLHRLEFHRISFEQGVTWEKDGVTVKGGDSVINIHVPEDGPFRHEDVIESYRRAYRYFGCTGKQAFVCSSWLLYPGNYEFLSEKSNIGKFMQDFDIIDAHDVRCSGDLWRVFGPCQPLDDTSKFPRDTELQRGMIKYLNEHDYTTGYGYGVFLFDGEKVIK